MSTINGVVVADDNGWTPTKEIVRTAEMVNGNGDTIGDYVGTRYHLNYKWDELPLAVQTALLTATDPVAYPTFTVTHPTLSGTDHTGTYRVIDPLQGSKIQYSKTMNRVVWVKSTLSLIEVMVP